VLALLGWGRAAAIGIGLAATLAGAATDILTIVGAAGPITLGGAGVGRHVVLHLGLGLIAGSRLGRRLSLPALTAFAGARSLTGSRRPTLLAGRLGLARQLQRGARRLAGGTAR